MNTKVTETYPLSSGQQALWLIYQIAPERVAYNIFITAKINSPLNISAFITVWNKIVERHPILRTTYTSHEGKPLQQINETQELSIKLIDASHWSEDYLKEKIFAETDRPFNLETDSVLRINLFTCSEKEHILLLTMHHIAGDMWSFDILLREFQALYTAQIEQADSVKGSLIQNKSYTEFVRWQSEMLSDKREEKHWQYWEKQLAGELPFLNLLPDKPRPPRQTYQGESHLFRLEDELIEKLNNLAQTSGKTLYGILLTAFFVLLYRYTNQEDILIGSPMRGHRSGDFKAIIGYFVNLVPLRISLEKNIKFTELLAQVSNIVKQAQKHQDYPFSRLTEKLAPERDPSRPSLCQVIFTWQSHRWCQPIENSLHSREQVLQMEPFLLGHQRGADFDLNLGVMEAQGVLQLCWHYNTDLFEDSTITRITGHFVTLLEGIVAHPEAPISQLPILTATEQQQLTEWNNTQTDYPIDRCLHQLFEAQVERTPNAVAVVFEEQQLTYRELNNRANQLANYLHSSGVGADVPVGICVERSIEMVVGLLGILKAGGAYVPLDPEYPSERLRFMLTNSSLTVLLTQQKLLDSLPEHNAQIFCLDTDWQAILEFSQENLLTQVQPENLAYVIYTSGSTGQPKGAMNTHKGICNRLLWMQEAYQLTTDDVVLQKTPFSFDVSVWEFFWTLLNGSRLVVAKPGGHRDSEYLVNLIAKEQVTTLHFVPSMLQAFLESPNLALCESLRRVICSGEALSVELQTKFFARLGCDLHNLYGPTEAAIDVTYWECVEHGQLDTVPIGRPIANTQIYILDRSLQPVPIGVPGELHIGGVGLATGYLNRPELTNEKFIPHPFSNEPNSRLYKTGDLARYLQDGNIEYLGRIDHQVKIRGFRIELGEIEAILGQHPQIQTSVVIARVDNPEEKRLVAYLVSDSEATPTSKELRQYIKAKLPEYMVPSAFVFLETLPLTPNGKIDRRALPAPDFDNAPVENYVAPRTPIEEILIHLFSQVLKLHQVGIKNNFFELGGHSLLATQLMSRIRSHLQVELPLQSLFTSPTVAELAPIIEQLQQQNLQLSSPPIVKRDNQSDLPLSFAQSRLWFIDQFQPNSALYNIPAALRLEGNLSVAALEQSLKQIIQRHEALRTNFIAVDGQPRQIIHSETSWNLSIVDGRDLSNQEPETAVPELLQQQALAPYDLANDCLLRATLITLSDTEHILNLCMHHIVSDGWSIGVFVAELTALYNAYAQGQPTPLSPLPIQYTDFTIWQREWLQGEVLQSQLSYWQNQLSGAPAILSLPTDRPRPAVQTYVGAHQKFSLSAELTEKLTQLSQAQGVTLFMTLLAAFDTLLYRYSGQTDIVVGSPIANRNHHEIEGLIGFFVNNLVLRTDLSNNPSFAVLLNQVREVSLGAYTHQDLPFEMLVEVLQPERDISYSSSPLFQVVFALQNAPLPELELGGLTLSPIEVENALAKFDLVLSMQNTRDGLVGTWEYNTDLFDGSTILRMTAHFLTLLEGIVVNPQTPIAQLPMLTAAEQQQLLVEWNNTQTDYPTDKCLHQLFEEQVEKTPDAVAVVFDFQQLTYRELNDRSNQLAHYLRSLGVGADVLVGICVERSIEMIVGLLGILKAGGAYVPLDSEYPTERLRFILENSQVSVLLTNERTRERLSEYQGTSVCLDTDWQVIQGFSQDNPIAQVQATNLAYVIYTSGSTGIPKGVLITHQSLLNLVFWHQSAFKITSSDKATQLAGTAFDAAVWELWPYLTKGASIYLVSGETLHNPIDLRDWLIAQKISISFVPTPLAEKLFSLEWPESVDLRTMLIGGDKLQSYPSRSLPFSVVNNYGPTENTVVTTSGLVVGNGENNTASPPIGRPIANTQVYILDSHLQPVPVCVPGELHIGGAGLARGYLNRPELTIEKFIPNPFVGASLVENLGNKQTISGQNPPLLYKTGDLARYLPDGNIEFLGRIDNQVKIRGFRIELGEIEAILRQHPLVQESVVVAREDSPGDKRLVAYLVPGVNRQDLPEQVTEWQGEYVSDWQTLYEQTYSQVQAADDDLTFNIAGWNSSYTREAIPAEEMRLWVESVVSRILSLSPKRVLEIGCGTGLLLSRVAKNCLEYWGTDYSSAAIGYVEQLCGSVVGLENVQLRKQTADNFADIPKGKFDTVILNSVVQYFPSVDYLLQVLEGAIGAMDSSGAIFVGDVRSLPLLEPFHAAVKLAQATEDRSVGQWRQQVSQSIATEEELVIDPRFFIALTQRFPEIGWLEIQPKRGYAQNELIQFRYDVTLHLGVQVQTTAVPWLDWLIEELSFSQIEQLLQEQKPHILGIRNVPNQRVSQALQICAFWKNSPDVETVNELRQLLAQQPTTGINPEQFWELGEHLGYTVHLSWWKGSQDGSFDVVFCSNSSMQRPETPGAYAFWNSETVVPTKSWSEYTNNPLQGKLVENLVPQVREFIQQRLPNYMVPSAFVTLEALPLTPNGKIDRRALPEPSGHNSSDTIVLPRNPVELKLAHIWSTILKLDLVGVKDNFFDLGGHSLLAPYLMAQLKEHFGKDIPLAALFQNPTIEQLAIEVQKDADTKGNSPLVAIQPTGEHPPLFCVPGAGGYPFYLYNLARFLPSYQPFYSFQASYDKQKLVSITSVEEKATHYIQAMQAVQPQGPYFLAGHSFGGQIAYEMALQLLAQGEQVALLAILDATAPQRVPTSYLEYLEKLDDVSWMLSFDYSMKAVYGKELNLDAEQLRSLAPEAQVQYVLDSLKMADLLAPDADPAYLSQVLQVYRAESMTPYVPQQFHAVPVTLLRSREVFAAQESEISDPEILEYTKFGRDNALGWNAFSSQPVDVHFVPGDHVTILRLPHVQVLAERLNACIQQVHLTIKNGELTFFG